MDLLTFLQTYFEKKNTGDTPKNLGQCVGLVEVYADTYKIPHEYGNAKDLLTNANPAYEVVTINNWNDLNQYPVAGDIIVWGPTWGGGLGHCGIIMCANGTTFSSFEQNNPIGSAPIINNHMTYSGVLGWLHIKNLNAR